MNTFILWVLDTADQVPSWVPAVIGIAAGSRVLGVTFYLMYRAITARARATIAASQEAATKRGRRFNWKLELGFAVVQAGLSVVTILGVYEFFHKLLYIPDWEAALFAGFIEAAIWTSVGFIVDHGRSMVEKIGKDGQVEMRPATGWGLGGPFFWIFSGSAGTLAVLAASSTYIGIGRAVVVVVGTSLWVLRLMRATNRPARRSRFRWSPYRIAVRIGWIEPDPIENEEDQNYEWRVQRLTRAIRLKNAPGKINKLTRWRGARMETRLAEEVGPELMRAAMERYAAVRVLSDHTNANSDVMRRIIEAHAVTTVRLIELAGQVAVDGAQRELGDGKASRGVIDGDVVPPALPSGEDVDEDEVAGDVASIAGQFVKDQAGARTIASIVMAHAKRDEQFATWAELRKYVADHQLLRTIERDSKNPGYVSMGKPRVVRILDKAETLYPVPPAPERVAKSA